MHQRSAALVGPCLSCILPGGEKLASAGWASAAGDDLAGSGRPELQANAAALLAVGMVLILRLGFAQLVLGEHWSGCGGEDRAGEPGDASDGSGMQSSIFESMPDGPQDGGKNVGSKVGSPYIVFRASSAFWKIPRSAASSACKDE